MPARRSEPTPPKDPKQGDPALASPDGETLWRATFDAVPDLLVVLDPNRTILHANTALLERVKEASEGRAGDCIGRKCFEVFHGTDGPPPNCPLTLAEQDLEPHGAEVTVERLGQDCQVIAAPVVDARGLHQGTIHIVRDPGDRRVRERGLHHLSRMIQALSRSSQAMARAQDEPGLLNDVCRIVVEECGCRMAWIGYRLEDARRSIAPMAWAGFEDGYLDTLRLTWGEEARGQGPTGSTIRTGEPCRCEDFDQDPHFAPWRAEARARGYACSLALPLLDGARAFGALTMYAAEPSAFSTAQERVLTELSVDLAQGILTLRLRESESRAQEALRETTQHLRQLNDELEQIVQARTAELVRANQELTARLLDRDKALEALRQSEETLRHVQKMEAIGTLAGGVAHDFNNLLQVITGYAEVALTRLEDDGPLKGCLETIQRAGQKGAGLTRQLLAFSRRQVLAPEILDLNQLLREMEAFFKRVLQENIQLEFDLEPELGRVKADPGQLEQVIMNLVVNARDAMPQGGTLTLTTRNAGGNVAVSVADTGVGMSEAVQARIFEPFYTTKGVGKGTGLGLATALGIVEQSGGTLQVASAPGAGTTLTITLPRAEGPLGLGLAAAVSLAETGDETILVVEDDPEVRGLTCHHLGAAGYRILEAPGAAEALDLARDPSRTIHLLLTDMMMPGLNGGELAEALRALRPEVRVVYMSGYPADNLPRAVASGDAVLIAKPFDRARLMAVVRQVLDAEEPRRGGL
jgi:signal transduction histidine kinase/ActR/RegA family two-component response regulator